MRHASICFAPFPPRGALIAIAACSLAHSWAHAVTTYWNTNSSGFFTTAGNWDAGAPDSDDTAVFDRGLVAYEVNFPGGSVLNPPVNYEIDYLRVLTNEVSFVWVDSPAATVPSLTVNNSAVSIVIGQDAGDVAILNTTLAILSGANTSIGRAAGAQGTLNVGGRFNLSESLTIGDSGKGTMIVAAGGGVSDVDGLIGLAPGSNGMATVTGAGSTWNNSDFLVVGAYGRATLLIEAGGSVANDSSVIGVNPSSIGAAMVTGPGSTWTINDELEVGIFGSGTLTIDAGASVSSLSSRLATAADISSFRASDGTVTVTGAGSTWTSGNLDVGVAGRGTLNITGGGAVSSANASVGTTGVTLEQGLATVDGLGSSWSVSGDLTVGGNNLTSFRDTLMVSGGGDVSVGGLLSVGTSGTVAGNSTLSAIIVNRGVVSPGLNPGVLTGVSPGALVVDGSYLQSASGQLRLRLAGTTPGNDYDQLRVNGAVTLRGTLSVALANSFVPSVGDDFNIFDWGSVSGAFATIQLPALPAGLMWNASQLYTTGVLSVSPALDADFDDDGDVDAMDLTRWQTGYLTGTTHMQGDADGDLDVDGADFLVWQRQLGSAAPAVSANAPVPEPATAVLVIFAAVGIRRISGQMCQELVSA